MLVTSIVSKDSARILNPAEGAPNTRVPGEEQPARPDQTDINIEGEEINPPVIDQEQSGSNIEPKSQPADNGVFIMNAKPEDRATSFFAQPGILAAVIGGAVVGLLCAILVVMFIVYRMRKKDEGSYALDEPKRSPAAASYGKGHNNREFYA
ncbi:syndecan isoform X2 [Bicyclus anynana]|uniref:Syndecan n=1 Tax=Bicyclus anynana TaxID=110368 RepID=A0A6J1NCT5_BICAN|nr:syndecan isoform X2 [Bicyclus anynana]